MNCVHVVTAHNAREYADALDQYFRLRHQVFVEERGWEALRSPDGIERDAFDNEHAIYLLAMESGRVVGGLRLYPSTLPHILSEFFPWLAARGVPSSPTIVECSRYFVLKERRAGRLDCRLLSGAQEYCLSAGIEAVSAVVETWWLPRWQQVGFKVRPLGVPEMIENEPCIATLIEISKPSLDSIRKIAGLRSSSLFNPMERERHAAS